MLGDMIQIYEALGMKIKIWHGYAEHDFSLEISNIFYVRLNSKKSQTMTFTEIVDSNIGNAFTNYCFHLPEPSFFFNRKNHKLVCFSAGTYTSIENKYINSSRLQRIYDFELLDSKKSTDSWEVCFFDKQEGIITVLDSKQRKNIQELYLLDSFSFLCEDNQLVGYAINLKNYYGNLWSHQEADFLFSYLDLTITPDWDDETQEKMACDSIHKLLDSYKGKVFYNDIPEIRDMLTFFDD